MENNRSKPAHRRWMKRAGVPLLLAGMCPGPMMTAYAMYKAFTEGMPLDVALINTGLQVSIYTFPIALVGLALILASWHHHRHSPR